MTDDELFEQDWADVLSGNYTFDEVADTVAPYVPADTDNTDWSGYANLTPAQLAQLAATTASNNTDAGLTPGGSSTGSASLTGIANALKGLLTNSSGGIDLAKLAALGGGIDLAKLAALGGGLYGASKSGNNTVPAGYQGKIPTYAATRNAPTAGQRLSGDVTYTPKAAAGGLVSDGFVIPADVVSHLGNGSSDAGLKLLSRIGATPIRGEGDGMSDSIKTTIDGTQEARVAHEEAFMSPERVAAIGGGDPEKGAKKLYSMMERIRKARTGSAEQGKEIDAAKFMPGGSVDRYATGGTTTIPAGTTGTESSLSNWAGDYVTGMLGKGQALAEMPYEAYTGPLTAGPSALQTQAFGQAAGLQTPAAIGQASTAAGDIATKAQGLNYAPTQFGSQFTAPSAYTTGTFGTDTFGTDQAKQYMNPYLQASLDPQLAEARRQSEIARIANAGRLTKAGAFGGSRQAVMEAEGERNLGTNLANITGQGYNTAYSNAMSQFNADQARKQAAQTATEQSRQFGAGQDMTAAQQQAQYGQAAQTATEASKQFGANLGLQGLQTGLQAAQAQGQLGQEAQQVAAEKAAFEEARLNPYKMVQFQQSLLSGLPLSAQTYNQAPTDNLTQFAQSARTVNDLLAILQGTAAAPKAP
jgi:hypothetical protein